VGPRHNIKNDAVGDKLYVTLVTKFKLGQDDVYGLEN